MRVCLFEDRTALDLEPLALTRPVFDLLCGCVTLGEKHFRAFSAGERGAIVRPLLADATRIQHPEYAINDAAWLSAGPVVLVNARWLPPAPHASPETAGGPCVGLVDGEIAYAILPREQARALSGESIEESLVRLRRLLPTQAAGGSLVRYLWDIVDHNAEQISLDAWLSSPLRPRRDDGGMAVVGPTDRLHLHPTARVDPFVVADTSAGPVVIDREAVVTAFTRLEGPCYVGPGTHLYGAKIRAGTSLGPHCRIGGEVEASVVLGHSNKYHDGFLGHACVGEWVNLGAGTSNSDLRNDYGEVRVVVNGALVATGRSKVGCFLGDHTKSGLGTLLNTGTSAGAFCNLLPTAGLLPKYVPSFSSVWNGKLVENGDLESLLRTAEKVMSRRGQELTPVHRSLYREVHEGTESRRMAVCEADTRRRLRKSA